MFNYFQHRVANIQLNKKTKSIDINRIPNIFRFFSWIVEQKVRFRLNVKKIFHFSKLILVRVTSLHILALLCLILLNVVKTNYQIFFWFKNFYTRIIPNFNAKIHSFVLLILLKNLLILIIIKIFKKLSFWVKYCT